VHTDTARRSRFKRDTVARLEIGHLPPDYGIRRQRGTGRSQAERTFRHDSTRLVAEDHRRFDDEVRDPALSEEVDVRAADPYVRVVSWSPPSMYLVDVRTRLLDRYDDLVVEDLHIFSSHQ
jgi:hypothetical protein